MNLRCSCGKTLRVPDHLRGKKVRCPDCEKILQVPAPILEIPVPRKKSESAPRGFPWLYVGLTAGAMALLTCCGVGAIAAWLLNEPQHAAKRSAPPNEGLQGVNGAGGPQEAEAAPPVGKDAIGLLFLEAPDPPNDMSPNNAAGLLVREMFRQSLLLTASDHLGVTVRDAALGDLPPKGLADNQRVHMSVGHNPQKLEVTAWIGTDPTKEPLLHDETRLTPRPGTIVWLTVMCEPRPKGQLWSKLRSAGFYGTPNQVNNDVKVPEEIEELLGQMTDTAQFQAVRQLHALMKSKGESPWLLGALARGYANLGVLTEYHWSCDHKAFKARALLYAQRLTSQQPEQPWAFWHRSYAFALVGLHEAALRDLAQAVKLSEDGIPPSWPKQPAWVNLIHAYCTFDTARIRVAGKAPQFKQLADLLAFLTVEDLHSDHLTLDTARGLLDHNSECYRVHDSISGLGGVRNQHVTTLQGMDVFTTMFPKRVALMPGLPPAVSKLTDSGGGDPQVCKALILAGQSEPDTNPLSWAVLGRLGQEIRFAQVCRRLDFMYYRWHVPTEDFVREAMPLVADHAYLPFVLSFAVDRARDRQTFSKLIRDLPRSFHETAQAIRGRVRFDLQGNTFIDEDHLWIQSRDDIYRDYWFILDQLAADLEKIGYAQATLKISPHAPIAKASLIKTNWASVQQNAAAWEKGCQHPRILYELGLRYLQLQRKDDAERCLQKCLELSPDLVVFRALAAAYKAQGKMDKWQQTLEAYLKEEDTGLGHAKVQVEIAQEYMKRKEWRKALPVTVHHFFKESGAAARLGTC